MKHRAIVPFGVRYQPRVLLRREKFLFADVAIAADQLRIFSTQFDELADDFLFARLRPAGDRRESVLLRIFTEMIEASIAVPRPFRRRRIDFIEVTQDRLDRRMHAVKIEAIESGCVFLGASA